MAMTPHTLAEDLALKDIESGEQGGDAMPLVIVGHGSGATLLHRQSRLGAVQSLDLAFLIDRQHDGMIRRIDIQTNDLLELGGELRIIGQLELAHQMRLRPCARHIRCTELTLIPAALAIAEPVQWLAVGGGPASVVATTRSTTSGLSGGIRDGRVISRQSPAAPCSRNRSCQRRITVLALPVACMISAVPQPSAVRRMIFARQTCFCGLFRFATTASSL